MNREQIQNEYLNLLKWKIDEEGKIIKEFLTRRCINAYFRLLTVQYKNMYGGQKMDISQYLK